MKSADDLSEMFACMFSDSAVAQKFAFGRTKATYTINCGLAPYFTKQLKETLETCGPYIVCVGESLNQVVNRGQMDLAFQ